MPEDPVDERTKSHGESKTQDPNPKTLAEMNLYEKNKISHRGAALRQFVRLLESSFGL